jgi:hypothetical protein
VGPHLLIPSYLEVDTKEATDLIVLQGLDKRIAARVRRPGFALDYGWEFTIRSHRDSGAKTELAKIEEGFGDWMFYGHAAASGVHDFDRWMIINLDTWRAARMRGAKLKTGRLPNGDGTWFDWWDIRSFPYNPPILIAASFVLPERIPDLFEAAAKKCPPPPEVDDLTREEIERMCAQYAP